MKGNWQIFPDKCDENNWNYYLYIDSLPLSSAQSRQGTAEASIKLKHYIIFILLMRMSALNWMLIMNDGMCMDMNVYKTYILVALNWGISQMRTGVYFSKQKLN